MVVAVAVAGEVISDAAVRADADADADAATTVAPMAAAAAAAASWILQRRWTMLQRFVCWPGRFTKGRGAGKTTSIFVQESLDVETGCFFLLR